MVIHCLPFECLRTIARLIDQVARDFLGGVGLEIEIGVRVRTSARLTWSKSLSV